MSKYQLSEYYQLRRKVMGYLTGKSNVRFTDEELSRYVMLYKLYIWNVKDDNEKGGDCK